VWQRKTEIELQSEGEEIEHGRESAKERGGASRQIGEPGITEPHLAKVRRRERERAVHVDRSEEGHFAAEEGHFGFEGSGS